MKTDSIANAFTARGGWWVVAQLVMFVAAYLIPGWYGWSTSLASLDAMAGVGYALLAAGLVLFVVAALTLGRALTPFPRPIETAVLRTGGVYALVRHPIYAGVLIMAIGWSLVNHSIAGLGFDLLLLVFFDRKSAREERWLVERFPDYVSYRQQVCKLIPWIY